MTNTMQTSEVLNRAADLIEERGWARGFGGWRDEEGSPLCLEGAIAAVTGALSASNTEEEHDAFRGCPAYVAMMRHLATDDRWGIYRDELYDWNDADGRTASEVIEVLRACAVIEASRERQAAEVSA